MTSQPKDDQSGWSRHPLVVALAAALVTGVCTLGAAAISSRGGSTLGGVLAPPITSTVTLTTTVTAAPATPPKPETSTSSVPELALSDVPRDSFVKRSLGVQRGAVLINGNRFPSAYSYRFSNCSSCTSIDEFSLPAGYGRITGDFGLTDDTRHDSVIDGIVYASIYVDDVKVWGPTKVEYPATAPIDIAFSGSRISLRVSDGTNNETAAWVSMVFH